MHAVRGKHAEMVYNSVELTTNRVACTTALSLALDRTSMNDLDREILLMYVVVVIASKKAMVIRPYPMTFTLIDLMKVNICTRSKIKN